MRLEAIKNAGYLIHELASSKRGRHAPGVTAEKQKRKEQRPDRNSDLKQERDALRQKDKIKGQVGAHQGNKLWQQKASTQKQPSSQTICLLGEVCESSPSSDEYQSISNAKRRIRRTKDSKLAAGVAARELL